MIATLEKTPQADRLGLPWNLAEWIDKGQLLRWIEQNVANLDWDNPTLVAYLKTHPGFRPQMLLTLITFAYALGVYASEEIAELCYSDPTFRDICAKDPPSAKSILVFRRENRGLLKWILVELFKQALKERFSFGDTLLPPGLRRHLLDAAVTRIDIARHLDRSMHGPE
jgi:transposase